MSRILLKVLLIALCVSVVARFLFGEQLRKVLLRDAFAREVEYVCLAVKENRVSKEDVCSKPLIQIAALSTHYTKLQNSDGEWYNRHGWQYYPSVICDGDLIRLSFMKRTTACEN